MLVVISPAKRLDWDPVKDVVPTVPEYQADAVSLARTAARLSKAGLQALMDISPELARLNQARFKAFQATPDAQDVRPAMRAFAGDTYMGLEAKTLDSDAIAWAQDHLRILSGLYGLLRPCDAIQPYRLEMGSRLKTRKGGSLYRYWGDRLAQGLNNQAQAMGTDILVNCASQEYFSAVDANALKLRVITPVFMEDKPAGPKIVSFFAKRARGSMARFIVENHLTDPAALMEFDLGGYRYQPAQSEKDMLVFVRPQESALNAA